MVLFGKLLATQTSCLIFKMPAPSLDTLNVYMACPLHALSPNDFKVKIQVVGNDTTRVPPSTYITAVLFPVQHPFLDLALGVIQNPEVINNTPELKAISYLSVDDSNTNIENSEVDVLVVNKSGGVSRLHSRVLSMNYELGTQEQNQTIHTLPAPGGFIQVELDAKSGLSGGLLITRDDNPSILGMIIVSSSTSSNQEDGDCNLKTSKNLASKMFYIFPHILQCTSRFYRLTLNDPVKLANLCKYVIMQTFADDALPVVNHLGGDYMNNQQINQMNPFRHLILRNVHNFLSVSPLSLRQENETNSIRIKTALNVNPDFLDYFFSRQENSVVIIRSAAYVDKIKGVEITLDFEEDDMANILDWCYRGDPLANLELVCQLRTLNNSGEISLSSQVSFVFQSSEAVDRIHGQDYPRRNMQIPGAFFNKLNSFEVLRNFGMASANVKKLSSRPPGSWYQTCRNWMVNGSMLNATCRRRNQSEMKTSIDITDCNWIRNMDGHLECRDEPGPPPPSSGGGHRYPGRGAAMVEDIFYGDFIDLGSGWPIMLRHPWKYRSEYFIDYNL
jgi:hypothetical protein